MMNTYIALFRGINVGGKNILPMKGLVAILKALGGEKISTYIQSGNAVFQIKKGNRHTIAEKIGLKIREHYGFEPKVMLLDLADLQEAIENNPFEITDGKALHFFFLYSLPENPDLESLASLKSNSEEFKLIRNLFYLYAPNGIGRSKLAAKVEQSLGVPATARNWNTVSKLLSMGKRI
jgi:uncharacterized protein (DUF1697 family)